MDKIIQIANLVEKSRFQNPQRGQVYYAKGICPCICGFDGRSNIYKFLVICKPK